jgi:hypothetical protein
MIIINSRRENTVQRRKRDCGLTHVSAVDRVYTIIIDVNPENGSDQNYDTILGGGLEGSVGSMCMCLRERERKREREEMEMEDV